MDRQQHPTQPPVPPEDTVLSVLVHTLANKQSIIIHYSINNNTAVGTWYVATIVLRPYHTVPLPYSYLVPVLLKWKSPWINKQLNKNSSVMIVQRWNRGETRSLLSGSLAATSKLPKIQQQVSPTRVDKRQARKEGLSPDIESGFSFPPNFHMSNNALCVYGVQYHIAC